MADNAQKTPFSRSMQRFTSGVAKQANRILGKSVPATISKIAGPIVTVNYEVQNANLPGQVQMPVLGSRYYRPPYVQGEKGFAVSSDYYLGGMSGLGGGTADLSQRGNLTTQAWAPVGNSGWPSVDPNTNVVTGGSNGVLIRDSEGAACTLALTSSGVVITIGANVVTISSSGVTVTQAIQAGTGGADSVTLQHHTHGGGSPPTPGT